MRNVTGFNFTGLHHCRVTAQVKIDTENNFDTFTVEATRTPGAPASWQTVFSFNGAGTGSLTRQPPRRLQRADRRLRPLPPEERCLDHR